MNVPTIPGANAGKDRTAVESLLQNGQTQTAMMVSAITLIAQAFSRDAFRQAIHAPEWFSLFVALVVSILFASYQIWVVQRRTQIIECILLVPLVSLLLFAMALGTNNLAAEVIRDSGRDNQEIDRLRAQVQLGEEQLANERKFRKVLEDALKSLGVPLASAVNGGRHSEAGMQHAKAAHTGDLFSFFVGDALAQNTELQPQPARPTAPQSPVLTQPELQKLLEATRQYESRHQELQKEAQQLEEATPQQQKPTTPTLWKKW